MTKKYIAVWKCTPDCAENRFWAQVVEARVNKGWSRFHYRDIIRTGPLSHILPLILSCILLPLFSTFSEEAMHCNLLWMTKILYLDAYMGTLFLHTVLLCFYTAFYEPVVKILPLSIFYTTPFLPVYYYYYYGSTISMYGAIQRTLPGQVPALKSSQSNIQQREATWGGE